MKKDSEYKNVYKLSQNQFNIKRRWQARITVKGIKYETYFETEKQAAIAVDKFLIKNGKEPKNILKKVAK